VAAFARVGDPRRAASVTYPLAAILSLAVTAILANHLSELAIAQWGARQPAAVLGALGFADGRTPCQSTLQRLFCKLDGQALAEALSAHFGPVVVPLPAVPGSQGVAIDGKAQRGRLPFQQGGSPVHMLTAYCHEHGVVLAQEPIGQGQEKSEAELTVAPALIARVTWPGRVLTGDALFCQRTLCRQVCAAGGDYVLLVKENQPTLHADLALLFDPPATVPALPLLDRREVRTVDRGHGRQQDTRHLVASTDLAAYLDWPYLAQVFRLERTWQQHGTAKRELHYGISSLSPTAGPPARLLDLKRGHWRIENGLHRVKDVTLGEDQSTTHKGQGPTVMALLRDAALNLLRRAGIHQIAARLRAHSQDPTAAIALVLAAPPPHTRAYALAAVANDTLPAHGHAILETRQSRHSGRAGERRDWAVWRFWP
jgi:predicted transposase YbfD/YdcC